MQKGRTGESHSDLGVSYSGLAFYDADARHDAHRPPILISKPMTLRYKQSRGKVRKSENNLVH